MAARECHEGIVRPLRDKAGITGQMMERKYREMMAGRKRDG